MIWDVITPTEARRKYELATNKRSALTIIAGLTASTPAKVAAYLGVDGKAVYAKMDGCKAQELYDRGFTDEKIAEKLGVTRTAVYNWRQMQGLPAVSRLPSHQRRMEVYNSGLSDRAAADKLGISRNTYRYWRKRHGLPPVGEEQTHE